MSDEEKRLIPPEDDGWKRFDWKEGEASWQKEDIPPEPAPEEAKTSAPPTASKRKRRQPMSVRESVMAGAFYVAGVLLLSFCIATLGWQWANDLLALDKDPHTVSITVEEGESLEEVAEDLKFNGLIEYKFLFKLFAGFTKKGSEITTGTYELSTEMDYSALLSNISSTSQYRETVTVTLPEGFTVAEMFQLLEDQGVCTVENLEKAAEEGDFDYDFLSDTCTGIERLEGYLFPDTYQFYKGADGESVLNRLLSTFDERFDEEMEEALQLLAKDRELTKDDIIIIASIIEKETTGTDRKDISSVIHNRLNNPDRPDTKGYLQMDSTVQFCLDERKEELTEADLEIDSPYNTYKYPGLPIGPICCPGIESIQAALAPNDTNYYYFMLGNDGEDHFFEDHDAFEAFKAETKAAQEED